MFNRTTKYRLSLAFLVLAGFGITLCYVRGTRATVGAGLQSVIVQLRDDPAAVYRAKIQKAGGSVTDDQLQAYRNTLHASQDQFLQALQNNGVTFSVHSVDIKGFDGNTAATAQYRYTMVLNAVGLTLPQSALSIVQSMPQG